MKRVFEFLDNLTNFKVTHIFIIVGLITFANALFNPFVWDDSAYILNNPTIKDFNFFGNNIFNNSGQYRPLTIAYFALLHGLFGNLQFFYHLSQILLHILNTCLLFVLFKSFFDKRLALFLGLVFLVHPMQVESVSYISAAGGALSFLFGITALLIAGREKTTNALIFLQYTLLLASVLVKETGILFFPLVIFYQWILRYKNIKSSIIYSFSVIAIYLFIRIGIGNIFIADRPLIPIARLSFFERLITIPEALFYYIKTFFFPASLAIDQHWLITTITFQDFYLPLLLNLTFFCTLIFLGIFIYKTQKENIKSYLFFCLWFIMGLALHSQIIPLDMTVADRWFYFDMVGLLGIIGISTKTFLIPVKNYRKIILAIVGIIIVLLSIKTISRNYEWGDHTRLYSHDIGVSDNFLIQEEFALDLVRNGKLKEALIPARKSIEYFPHEENLYNLGYIYEKLGSIEQAKEYYIKALQAKNYTPGETHHSMAIYIRLANILVYFDDPNKAKKFIEHALTYYPYSDRLWLLLGISEYKLQNHNAALEAVEHAYKLSPKNETNINAYMRLLNNHPLDLIFKN